LKDQPEVKINPDWCKSCGICVAFCPRQVLAMGTFYAEVAHPELCTGCRMCESLCPDFAITVSIPAKKQQVSEERK
jgi:NAD-dependent dihydropyrimidine dehydrogenase PreA subunit